MFRVLPLLAALVIILVSGLAEGLITDRWKLSPEPMASVEKLQDVPKIVGDWESKEMPPISQQELAIGKIEGHFTRLYTNRHTGAQISVMLLCGRPGPIGVHTPDVCLGGGGNELMSRIRYELEVDPAKPPAEFVVGDFKKMESDIPTYKRVYWTWGSGGRFSAPDSPRWTFAGRPALFKLYFTRQLADENEPVEKDVVNDFAKVFIPLLDAALFGQRASAVPADGAPPIAGN